MLLRKLKYHLRIFRFKELLIEIVFIFLKYILRSLQRSSLLEVVSLAEPDCEENYNDMILEQKRLYSQSWAKVLSHIW